MGNLEQLDNLEGYINELGDEIKRVKKASEYLKLIEQMQLEITQASTTLTQSRDQLKLYQDIMENKFELFQTTARNTEAKQQLLEQTQHNIIAIMAEFKQQQVKNEKELNGVIQLVNLKHNDVVVELNLIHKNQEEHKSFLTTFSKTSKTYFIVNTGLIVSVAGILIYLLVK